MKNTILASSLAVMSVAFMTLGYTPSAHANTTHAAKEVKPEFEGHCAMGVCEDKYVKADSNFKLEKDGKTYYFASEAAKETFEAKFAANKKKAEKNWRAFRARGGSRAQ